MRRTAHALTAVLVTATVALLGPALPASAAAREPTIGISPVGTDQPYLTETMSPGTTRQLTAALINHGTTAATAITYPADVYTIVNGGFGARLRDQPATGVTTWISYPRATVKLGPGKAELQTFTVSVPATATPGEHVTSIVVENPEQSDAGGALSMDQITRQALPIVIDVPGARVPGLAVGAVTQTALGGRTIIGVSVTNSGNVREHPAGQILVIGPDRHDTEFHVAMGTVYPGDTTTVTAAFAGILPAGRYAVSVTLTDAALSLSAQRDGIALKVSKPSSVIVAAPTVGSHTAAGAVTPSRPTTPATLIAALIVGSLLAGAGLTAGTAALRRRKSSMTATGRHDPELAAAILAALDR
jgi:hypothetical protein